MRLELFILILLITSQYSIVYSQKAQYDINDVFIRDYKLFVRGKEFWIKGFTYSPHPLGWTRNGLCTPHPYYTGGTKSDCSIEGDFYNQWWTQAHRRDLAKMRETGANSVRIYHWDPFSRAYISKFGGGNANLAYEHISFMDIAWQNNLMVNVPLVCEEHNLVFRDDATLRKMVEAVVDEVGNHPALLMFTCGNELNLPNRPDLAAKVDMIMRYTRSYMLTKWNRFVPVSYATEGNPFIYSQLLSMVKMDLFQTNAGYSGLDFGPAFSGYQPLGTQSRLPILISEYGQMNTPAITASKPDWLNMQIKSLIMGKLKYGIGGYYFGFIDQIGKPSDQQHMGIIGLSVKALPDGTTSVTPGVAEADSVYEKPVLFQAAKSGIDGPNKQYNYNADVYALTGTVQTTISLPGTPGPSPNPPPSNPPPSPTCTGVNNCNGHGTCINQNVCLCSGNWAAPSCANCASGYTGTNCEIVTQTAIRVNVGGPAYTTTDSRLFVSDNSQVTSTVGTIQTTTMTISNTPDQPLYQSRRYNGLDLVATHNVPNGQYLFALHFAEIIDGYLTPGKRSFDIYINSVLQSSGYDIVVKAGGGATAVVFYKIVAVTNGVAEIRLKRQIANSALSAYEIVRDGVIPAPGPGPAPNPPPPPPPPPASYINTVRLNIGGPQYTDAKGAIWTADQSESTERGVLRVTTAVIAGTSDQTLFNTYRYNTANMKYEFNNLENGQYTVKMCFAETSAPQMVAGARVFDISLNNQIVISNLDIYRQASANTALIKTATVLVTDHKLIVLLVKKVENPRLHCLEVTPLV